MTHDSDAASEDHTRKQGELMSTPKFTLALPVPDSDIDRQGHVNNVAFVRYIQEVAVAHWRAIAPEDVQSAVTWVVRKHEVEYFRPAFPGEQLVLKTWVGEPSGATWERFTEVFRAGEEKPLVTARTVWVLLDVTSGRPRRVDAAMVTRFINTDVK